MFIAVPPTTIAGHTFVDGQCSCGRAWTDIMNIDMSFMHEAGYAHTGNLNEAEINQIIAEKARRGAVFQKIINQFKRPYGGG